MRATSFRRLNGSLFLVVQLPDGSPGTIRADATDVLATGRFVVRPGARSRGSSSSLRVGAATGLAERTAPDK